MEYGAVAPLTFNAAGIHAAWSGYPAGVSEGADADAARVRVLAAYTDFLMLWKDADPEIPIYKQAKAEYAKLQ
jgi:hypothetical protein